MTTGNRTISAAPNKRLLVVGATSSLAQAMCRALARRGYALALAGRDEAELELLAADLRARFGTPCDTLAADFLDVNFSPHTLIGRAGEIDGLILASGDMGNGDAGDLANLAQVARVNYVIPAQIATAAALYFSEKKQGSIVIISSVSGDRGRQSNIAYGSAKAALSTFSSGLRNYLYPMGVSVLTVKPGFTDTPMTWGMKSPLMASREYVAEKIVVAMENKQDVIYVPWFWRYIMLIICHIPEKIFKRLKL